MLKLLPNLQVSNYCSGDVCVDDRAWPSQQLVSVSCLRPFCTPCDVTVCLACIERAVPG